MFMQWYKTFKSKRKRLIYIEKFLYSFAYVWFLFLDSGAYYSLH